MADKRQTDAAVFQSFVDNASTRTLPHQADTQSKKIEHVTVLGGATDARLLAALCFSEAANVQLFSAYAAELDVIAKGIAIDGAGPVGRYHVASGNSAQQTGTAIRTTASLDNCLSEAELIFLTGPVHKQRTYAMALADHLQDGQILVLPNARTFGALEAQWLLKVGGCHADVTLVEMQSLPYWVSVKDQNTGNALQLQTTAPVVCACLPANRTNDVISSLGELLGELSAMPDVLHTSFNDCSALVDIPALILGGTALTSGGPVIPKGGVPLSENESFYNLIGAEQYQTIEQLLSERQEVASRFGVRELPSIEDALVRWAGNSSNEGRRSVPLHANATALIRDGAIGSLVPVADAARAAGVAVPLTDSMITLCSSLLGTNLSLSGRKLQNFGVDATQKDKVFAQVKAATHRQLTRKEPGNNTNSRSNKARGES